MLGRCYLARAHALLCRKQRMRRTDPACIETSALVARLALRRQRRAGRRKMAGEWRGVEVIPEMLSVNR